MSLLRQVSLARSVALKLLGDSRADDVAHDVAVVLLEWPWQVWRDSAVESLATELANRELEHEARHVTLRRRK